MKILYVGNFSAISPGELEIASSFEELGHEVIKLNESDTNLKKIEDVLEKDGPDFLLFAKFRIHDNEKDKLNFLKKLNIPSVCWVFDLYHGL